MEPTELLGTTGIPAVDRLLALLIGEYAVAFPGQPISYYLIGSYADGTANELSDIDMVGVCRGWTPRDADRALLEAVHQALKSDIRLDVGLIAEEQLPASAVGMNVKLAGVLLYGEDIRDRIPLPPLEEYQRGTAAAARHFIFTVLRDMPPSRSVQYPDPDDEFFGYARKRIAVWYPPSMSQGLKELLATATRIATALVALQAGRYVGTKGESIRMYGEVVGGEWGDYLAFLYQEGKQEWMYHVPADPDDRASLRDLCRRFLSLEQHFLDIAPSE